MNLIVMNLIIAVIDTAYHEEIALLNRETENAYVIKIQVGEKDATIN